MERNKCIHQTHYFKQQSISKRVLYCERDTKELFHLINKLTGNTLQNPLPPIKTDEELAEDFAKFFLSKIEKIRESFTNTRPYILTHPNLHPFTHSQRWKYIQS